MKQEMVSVVAFGKRDVGEHLVVCFVVERRHVDRVVQFALEHEYKQLPLAAELQTVLCFAGKKDCKKEFGEEFSAKATFYWFRSVSALEEAHKHVSDLMNALTQRSGEMKQWADGISEKERRADAVLIAYAAVTQEAHAARAQSAELQTRRLALEHELESLRAITISNLDEIRDLRTSVL
jgi:hypothetical protein